METTNRTLSDGHRCLIIIEGRRWFQRSCGNTYHRASYELRDADTDETLARGVTEKAYGYGSQYIVSGIEAMEKAGVLQPRISYANGAIESLWEYCERLGWPRAIWHVADVKRERDL